MCLNFTSAFIYFKNVYSFTHVGFKYLLLNLFLIIYYNKYNIINDLNISCKH